MNEATRADLLKDEYVMLQNFYEDIDSKGLTIKNWAITVALASIGAGVVYRKEILIAGFFAALVFWYLEAYCRGLSHFFSKRIKDIERSFQSEEWKDELPLQVYATWSREFEDVGDQTWRYMRKKSSLLPHLVIALVYIPLYFLM